MADRKVWKLSDFEGGLNDFTDPKDLKVNEFASFQDAYCGKSGIIRPIGSCEKSLDILTLTLSANSNIFNGQGLASYNSNYTFQSNSVNDLRVTVVPLSNENDPNGQPPYAEFYFSSMMWLFEDRFPIGGTLTFTPTINNVAITSAITVLEGADWLNWATQSSNLQTFVIGDGTDWIESSKNWSTNIFADEFPFNNSSDNSDVSIIFDSPELQLNHTAMPWTPADFYLPNTYFPSYFIPSDDYFNYSNPGENLNQSDIIAPSSDNGPIFPWSFELIAQLNPLYLNWHDNTLNDQQNGISWPLVYNEERFILGSVTGATADANIPVVGNHAVEAQGVIDCKARWAVGYWDGRRYADEISNQDLSQIPWANQGAGDEKMKITNADSFCLPQGPSIVPDNASGEHLNAGAYIKYMQSCLMHQMVKGINSFAGSGETNRFHAEYLNPGDTNGFSNDIGEPFIRITADAESKLHYSLLNNLEISANFGTASLKPDSSGPSFVAVGAGSDTSSFIDSRIHLRNDMTNSQNYLYIPETTDSAVLDTTYGVSLSSVGGAVTAGTYSAIATFRKGMFIKIDNEIMKINKVDYSNYRVWVNRGVSGGWGNSTSATSKAVHTTSDTIFIGLHSTTTAEMAHMDALGNNNNYSEYQVPLKPIVIRGDARLKGGLTPQNVYMKELHFYGSAGNSDIVDIQWGDTVRAVETLNGTLDEFATNIASTINSASGYGAIKKHASNSSCRIILFKQEGAVETVLSSAVNETSTTINVTSASGIGDGTNIVGKVLVIESELLLVTAIDGTALTVERGAGGTNKSTHAASKGVYFGDTTETGGTITVEITNTDRTEQSYRGDDEQFFLLNKSAPILSNLAETTYLPGEPTPTNLYKIEANIFSKEMMSWQSNSEYTEQLDWKWAKGSGIIESFIYTVLVNDPSHQDTNQYINSDWSDSNQDLGVVQDATTGAGIGCTIDITPSTTVSGNDTVTIVLKDGGSGHHLGDVINFVQPGGSAVIQLVVSSLEPAAEQPNDILLWSQSGRLRICEANFKFRNVNTNKFFGFINMNSNFIGPYDNPTGFLYPDSVKSIGMMIENVHKKWDYSVDFAYGAHATADSTKKGLNVAAGTETVHGTHGLGPEFAQMDFEFTVAPTEANTVSDWAGSIKIYASAMYDDGSEGLIGHQFKNYDGSQNEVDTWDFGGTEGTVGEKYLQIESWITPVNASGELCFSDKRITGIHLYYTSSEEGYEVFWSLGKFHFEHGFIQAAGLSTTDEDEGVYDNINWKDMTNTSANGLSGFALQMYDYDASSSVIPYYFMPKVDTFESENAYSVGAETTGSDIKYKAVCIAGRRTFIGNVHVGDREYNDSIIVSPQDNYDIFPYPDNRLNIDTSDGDRIVALMGLGDKVLIYKQNSMSILDISTGIAKDYFVEKKHKYKGITHRNHTCSTDNGVFWFNKNGAFHYDGEDLKELIMREGKSEDKSSQRIDLDSLGSFINKYSIAGYNSESKELFIVKKTIQEINSDGDAYVYNLNNDSWAFTRGKFFAGAGKEITNFTTSGEAGKLSFLSRHSFHPTPTEGFQGPT